MAKAEDQIALKLRIDAKDATDYQKMIDFNIALMQVGKFEAAYTHFLHFFTDLKLEKKGKFVMFLLYYHYVRSQRTRNLDKELQFVDNILKRAQDVLKQETAFMSKNPPVSYIWSTYFYSAPAHENAWRTRRQKSIRPLLNIYDDIYIRNEKDKAIRIAKERSKQAKLIKTPPKTDKGKRKTVRFE